MRKCNFCLLEKNNLDFPKKGFKCKKCVSIDKKKYYENNKNKIKNKVEEYALINKDKVKLYRKEYNKNNPNLEYHKQYREKNKELISSKRKIYYKNNKNKIKEYQKKNKEYLYKKAKIYREKNKDRLNTLNREYIRNKKIENNLFKLKCAIRTLISSSFKSTYTNKSKKTIEILGCSFEEFKNYLETKFDENMCWNNYATYWQLDHIIPISWAKTEEDVYKLNHYSNFQPLNWLKNIKKSNKYSG